MLPPRQRMPGTGSIRPASSRSRCCARTRAQACASMEHPADATSIAWRRAAADPSHPHPGRRMLLKALSKRMVADTRYYTILEPGSRGAAAACAGVLCCIRQGRRSCCALRFARQLSEKPYQTTRFRQAVRAGLGVNCATQRWLGMAAPLRCAQDDRGSPRAGYPAGLLTGAVPGMFPCIYIVCLSLLNNF